MKRKNCFGKCRSRKWWLDLIVTLLLLMETHFLCWHFNRFFTFETVENAKFIYRRVPHTVWYLLLPRTMIHYARNNVKAKMLDKIRHLFRINDNKWHNLILNVHWIKRNSLLCVADWIEWDVFLRVENKNKKNSHMKNDWWKIELVFLCVCVKLVFIIEARVLQNSKYEIDQRHHRLSYLCLFLFIFFFCFFFLLRSFFAIALISLPKEQK